MTIISTSRRRRPAVRLCPDGQRASAAPPERIADLPSGPTGHGTRNIRFSPDRAWLYVTVGSSSIDLERHPLRAAVLRFRPDGTGREVVVTGTRNPVGLDFHPKTHEPWIAVQERDGLGDDRARLRDARWCWRVLRAGGKRQHRCPRRPAAQGRAARPREGVRRPRLSCSHTLR